MNFIVSDCGIRRAMQTVGPVDREQSDTFRAQSCPDAPRPRKSVENAIRIQTAESDPLTSVSRPVCAPDEGRAGVPRPPHPVTRTTAASHSPPRICAAPRDFPARHAIGCILVRSRMGQG